jgi:hypothetical protein
VGVVEELLLDLAVDALHPELVPNLQQHLPLSLEQTHVAEFGLPVVVAVLGHVVVSALHRHSLLRLLACVSLHPPHQARSLRGRIKSPSSKLPLYEPPQL